MTIFQTFSLFFDDHKCFFFFLFFKICFFFNWRLTALQYCIGFCHISTWISHRYMYVPSLLNLPHTDGTDEQGSNGDAEIENRFVDTWGEGEGGKNWEGNIETYIIPYVKLYSQCKFAVWCRELKSTMLYDNNECFEELFPRWLSGRESICQCRRCGFGPWVRKIPWRRK